MKKYFFTMMTTAMLFASCSSDDTVAPNNGIENQEDLVEIKLGAGSRIGTSVSESRTAVDAWNDTEVGVFAVDKAANANWTDQTSTDNKPVLMSNVKGTVVASASGLTSDITLEGNKRYYPRNSVRNYEFYGYYPYDSNSANIATVESANGIKVTGNFDGTQDIMAGKSQILTSEPEIGYFNAKYFRTEGESAETPNISFNHLTSRIQIQLLQGTDYTDETCAIKSIKMDLPESYEYDLVSVAKSFNDDDDTNVFTSEDITWTYPTTSTENGNVVIIQDNNGLTATDESAGTIPITCDFMVPAGNGNTDIDTEHDGYDAYRLYLTFTDPETNADVISEVDIKLTGYAAFEPGKKYLVKLKVHGPKEITVQATLVPWEDGENIETEI